MSTNPDEYWTDELEEIHEESSRSHFMDVWNRRAIIERLGPLPANPMILDAGCSTGYLLEDLAAQVEGSRLVGLDYLFAGLPLARGNVPGSAFVQGDTTALPFADDSLDAIVSANLLEHVPDDRAGLREFLRVLKPGARAVIVVPNGPHLYDYYDRFLHHQRRYSRHELATKGRDAGFIIRQDIYLGTIFYPAFYAVKKRNRLQYGDLEGASLAAKVKADIAGTNDSKLGSVLVDLERRLLNAKFDLPFGVRQLAVLERPL